VDLHRLAVEVHAGVLPLSFTAQGKSAARKGGFFILFSHARARQIPHPRAPDPALLKIESYVLHRTYGDPLP
jgi:hypothetical protein